MTIEEELALIKAGGAEPAAAAEVPAPAPLTGPAGAPASTVPQTFAPTRALPEDLPAAETGLPGLPETDASFGDVFGAAWKLGTIRNPMHSYRFNREQDLAQDLYDRLPPEAQERVQVSAIQAWGDWGSFSAVVLNEAAKAAAADPTSWGDVTWLDPKAFKAKVAQDVRADHDEAQAVLDQPGGGFAEFLGGSARAVLSPTNLAASVLGGPVAGSAWRFVLSEAAINAAVEGIDATAEASIADDLGAPQPNILARMGLGAVLGGGIAGAIIAVPRASQYVVGKLRARNSGLQAATPPGGDGLAAAAGVDGAEAKLRGEDSPQQRYAAGTEPKTLGAILAGQTNIEDRLYRVIMAAEAPHGFDTPSNFTVVPPPKPLTQMTVNEVLDWQQTNRQAGAKSTAAGGFQIIYPTLAELKARLSLTGAEVFDEKMQKRMARALMLDAGLKEFSAGLLSPTEFGNALAKIWAGLPVLSGSKAGRSFYGGDGLNAATITADDFLGVLRDGKSVDWANRDGGAMPAFTTQRGYTGSGQVAAGDEFRIDVDYQVVDLASLRRAGGDLQPRDRSRVASDAWIADTAARLDPAQLMPNSNAAFGPPIVGPDDVIESGNGRFGAIARAYERHPDRAAAYRAQIEAAGFAVPEGVERPVLVARRTSALSEGERKRFTVAAQDSGVAVMTPTEIARASAGAMDARTLAQLDPALPLTAEGNGDFVRAALATLPRSARNAMFDASGLLNAQGQRQLREAIFARAWSDPDIIEMFAEADARELKSLLEALDRAAPNWAALKADIEAGLVAPEMDISGFVLDAMRLIAAARKLSRSEGMSIGTALTELLDQVDMIEGAVSPLTAALVRKFWKGGRAASADDVTGFLARYADDARKAGQTGALFDAPTPRDVLAAIDKATFGDLPDNIGQARGFARPGAAAPQVEARAEGYEDGAASPEVEAADLAARDELERPTDMDNLKRLVAEGAPAEQLAAHPAVTEALSVQRAQPETVKLLGYDTEDWYASRRYRVAQQEDLSLADAMAAWERQAEELAWHETGAQVEPVARDREVTIILGPPAAGKSTVANELAKARKAAILDADEIKKSLPEYQGGIGAGAVHEESSDLAKALQVTMVERGTNIVLPKVGNNASSIEATIALYRKSGYRVHVLNMAVSPIEAKRRMFGRFAATGRIIDPAYLDLVGTAPTETYRALKTRGLADGYAEIDNNGAFGSARPITDQAGDDFIGNTFGNDGSGGGIAPRAAAGADESPGANAGQPRQGLTAPAPSPAALDLDTARQFDALRADLGDDLDAMEIDLGDGTSMSFREVLDDLDADAQLAAGIRACAITPAGAI